MKNVVLLLVLSFLLAGCSADTQTQSATPSEINDNSRSVFEDIFESPESGILENGTFYLTFDDSTYIYTHSQPAAEDICGELVSKFDAFRVYEAKGCGDMSRVIVVSDDKTYTEYSYGSDLRHYTEAEQKIRAVADAALLEKYPNIDLMHYSVRVSEFDDRCTVYYDLRFCGYRADSSYHVRMSSDKTVDRIDAHTEKELAFVDKFTPQQVSIAEQKIKSDLESYPNAAPYYYISLDKKGNLCLSAEVIINLTPPETSDGFIYDGCGIGHDHLFFSHIICEK